MNANDIGTIIAEARKKKGLTQNGLAKELHITRQAISNWETNKALPDVSIILNLCKVLEIDFNYFIGMANNDIKAVDVINYEKKKITKKTVVIITILSILFILISLTIYMILNKNAFAVYDVYLDSNEFSLSNSILVKSKINNYFKLGNLKSNLDDIPDDTVYNIKLYVVKDGEEKVFYEEQYRDDISIAEKYGYSEYFSSDIYADEDLYLDINYSIKDKIYNYTFPLNLNLNFESNRLFYTKDKEIEEENNLKIDTDKLYVDKLIATGYHYDEKNDYYIRNIENGNFTYYANSKKLRYYLDDNSNKITISYYFLDQNYDISDYNYVTQSFVAHLKLNTKNNEVICYLKKCKAYDEYNNYQDIIREEILRINK